MSCLVRNIAATSQALATPLPDWQQFRRQRGNLPKGSHHHCNCSGPGEREAASSELAGKATRTSKTHTAEAPSASVPQSSPVTVPRPSPSTSHAEENFITVVYKAA
ncbi:hypothetical protein MRX96_005486 [Rhipicephalus microplus]